MPVYLVLPLPFLNDSALSDSVEEGISQSRYRYARKVSAFAWRTACVSLALTAVRTLYSGMEASATFVRNPRLRSLPLLAMDTAASAAAFAPD